MTQPHPALIDLTEGLSKAADDYMSHLFEVLMQDSYPGDEAMNAQALQRFEVGARHLMDVYIDAFNIVKKI